MTSIHLPTHDFSESARLAVCASARARTGFTLLIALIALVGVAKAILADTLDPDAFWHFRVADQLVRDGIGPIVDSISFSSLKSPWTPYSWLAELFMKAVWDFAGYQGTILVTATCSAAIAGLIAWSSVLSRGSRAADRPVGLFPCVITTVIGMYLTLAFLSFRPVTFALVLMAIAVALIHRDRAMDKRSRAVWLVPAIALLTINLHMYGLFIAILTVLLAIGTWFDDRASFRRDALLAALTCIAACGTPMLPGLIETSLRYNAADPMVSANFIQEMQPFYAGIGGKISLAIVLVLFGLAIVRRHKLSIADWLWLGFSTCLLLRLGRFSPVFAIVALPILARVLPDLSDRVLARRPIQIAMSAVLLIGIVKISIEFPNDSLNGWLNRHAPEAAGYPTEASDWVTRNVTPQHHRIINEFTWGGYLAWRFGPQWQVLMDGRTQLYSATFWNEAYFGTPEQQRAILTQTNADAAILPAKRSAFRDNLESLGWRVAHEDAIAIVMVR